MRKNNKKYHYYKKEDLDRIDDLICEAKEGIKNPKRTWKDVSKELKKGIEKGFPAIAGLAVISLTFLAILKETRSIKKAIVGAAAALFTVFIAFFTGKKRQDGITEDELAKYKEVVKYQNEIIEKQNSELQNSKERENKLLKIIKKEKTTKFNDEHIDYLNKIEKSLDKVAKRLEDDLVIDGAMAS